MGFSLLVARLGSPLSLLVLAGADAIDSESLFFILTYPLLFLVVILEWSLLGALAGWAVGMVPKGPGDNQKAIQAERQAVAAGTDEKLDRE